MNEPFFVKLPLFEGPFDLLLFFIQRDELDIHDIPIAQITNDFLAYLSHLESLNIEVTSEFIVTAATLMRIKSRLLLPRPQEDENGVEIDPRHELAIALQEYQKYKSVIHDFEVLESARLRKYERGNLQHEVENMAQIHQLDAELQHLDLYKLLKAYTKVIQKYTQKQDQEIHSIIPYPYSISERKNFIINQLKRHRLLSFEQIMQDSPDKIAIIFTFLAILELIQVGKIEAEIASDFNQFHIKKMSHSVNSN